MYHVDNLNLSGCGDMVTGQRYGDLAAEPTNAAAAREKSPQSVQLSDLHFTASQSETHSH